MRDGSGVYGSLESLHRDNIKVVLSTDDGLVLAKNHPDKIVVFVAVGFETTTPPSAVAVADAAREGIDNFCILSGHKLVVPAMQALLGSKNDKIDAFLCPGHVSVILWLRDSKAFRFWRVWRRSANRLPMAGPRSIQFTVPR
jgi:hydrogenase expression/formation protein HypD